MAGPYQDQTHYFRDDNDNRTVVITTWLPTGEYGAYRDDEDDGCVRGFGSSAPRSDRRPARVDRR